MTGWTKHSQQACAWNRPRPHRDPSLRYLHHGPIQPMKEPCGILGWLLGGAK